MSKASYEEVINRATGLLVIDVINSNPNGDPDKESDPRLRENDRRGEISPVSFKRKLRDLAEKKDGPVWKSFAKKESLDPEKFMISESREAALKDIHKLNEKQFTEKFWDGRIFGNTELEKGRDIPVKTGVVQFGLGVSIAPISVERMTTTNPAVQEDKSRGMAPLAFRIVSHGIYCMPFFVNPTAAYKTGCTKQDIELLLYMIPYAYKHTASYIRNNVEFVHAWYIEHKSPLGSCSDFDLISALTPKKTKGDPEKPSTSRADYEPIPTEKDVPEELRRKVLSIRDLMKEI
ncbi:MAG: type I CRISPR-associated protein Cas7 [Bacteroidetes bacterium]|nr:type I CRISPR-associated protein Cas7 [Bacteroidota bacterium]